MPCGAVNGVTAALADPQAAARGMVMEVPHPTAGLLRMLGFPIKMSETPLTAELPPPLLGEHTETILLELGLDERDMARLVTEGAIKGDNVSGKEPA